MATMRDVEDRIERKLYRQGKILGGVYVGRGQEAIPVGAGLLAGGMMNSTTPKNMSTPTIIAAQMIRSEISEPAGV